MGDRGSRPSSPQAYNRPGHIATSNEIYHPSYMQNQQMLGSPYALGHVAMNREFCEALDNGTLDDIGILLQAYDPKPEVSNFPNALQSA